MSEFLFPDMDDATTAAEPKPARDSYHHPLVVSWGMGVNSTAMLIGMHRRGIRPDLILVADTGGEKPETYAYIEVFRGWLKEVGFPELEIVRNDGMHGTLEQDCLTNGVLPSRVYGFSGCAEKYKIRPQNKYVNQWPDAVKCWEGGALVCKAIGYDAGEPHRAINKNFDDDYHFWYPLIEWGWFREDCVRAIEEAGLDVPPKSACFFCPSNKKAEINALYREHPDLFARAVKMERNAEGYNEKIKGLGRHWSWESLVSLPLIDQQQCRESQDMPCVCNDGQSEDA